MQSNKWSIAAQNAIILALVTILATIIQAVFPSTPGFVGIVIWLVKLALSVFLVYYFIKEYSKNFETFTYKQGFRFELYCVFSLPLFVPPTSSFTWDFFFLRLQHHRWS